jgi:hypothetical protein
MFADMQTPNEAGVTACKRQRFQIVMSSEGDVRQVPFILALVLLCLFYSTPAWACNYTPAYATYHGAVIAYQSGDYTKAYAGARAAADKIEVCLKTDDPKKALTQEEKALWASYLAAAADAGSKMSSYPTHPTRSNLRGLMKAAIQAEEQVLASPYASEMSRATVRDDIPRYRAFLKGL